MIGFVYILKTKNNKYYIGSTIDIDKRIAEHNIGKTKSLKYLLPVCLLFKKRYDDIKIARKIEVKLKKLKSRKIIERIIRDQDILICP